MGERERLKNSFPTSQSRSRKRNMTEHKFEEDDCGLKCKNCGFLLEQGDLTASATYTQEYLDSDEHRKCPKKEQKNT